MTEKGKTRELTYYYKSLGPRQLEKPSNRIPIYEIKVLTRNQIKCRARTL